MELYPLGNIQDAGVLYDQYITVFAQILFGLSHLHKNGVAHRDLKPENVLVKKKPLTVAITDFGLSKVKDDDDTLFKTFCGNLNNLAPEAFPGSSDSDGYGLKVDIWSAGVIMLEWMYNVPNRPAIPTPRRKGQEVTEGQWRRWVTKWVELLLKKLDDQEDDLVVKILPKMIEPDPQKRWSADQCLEYGLQSGLFRMATDGRIVGVDDPDDEDDDDDGTKTPTTRSPRTQAMNVEKSILEGSLWGGGGSAVQRSKRRDLDRSVDGTDIFGTNWLRDPNCVASDVAALGDDVDGSLLSN
jgi:serine/threonine protein kinase